MKSRLKEIRKQKNISQYKLADMVGCTQAQIAFLEQGKIELTLKWMKILSEVLGCKPYELLPLEWQPQPLTEEEKQLLSLFRKKADNN